MFRRLLYIILPLLIIFIGVYFASFSVVDEAQNLTPTQKLVKFLEKEEPLSHHIKTKMTDYELITEFIDQYSGSIKQVLQTTKIDTRIFLVYCIDNYVKKHPIEYFKDSDLYDFILEDLKNPELLWDSKIYTLNKDELLFVWQNGRGNHNNAYWIWKISLKDDKFKPYLYQIEVDEEQKGLDYNINAQKVTYDPKTNMLIIVSNAGTKEGNHTIKSEFKLEGESLVLDKRTKL